MVKLEFDPDKSAKNAKERGLRFELAAQLDWGEAETIRDFYTPLSRH